MSDLPVTSMTSEGLRQTSVSRLYDEFLYSLTRCRTSHHVHTCCVWVKSLLWKPMWILRCAISYGCEYNHFVRLTRGATDAFLWSVLWESLTVGATHLCNLCRVGASPSALDGEYNTVTKNVYATLYFLDTHVCRWPSTNVVHTFALKRFQYMQHMTRSKRQQSSACCCACSVSWAPVWNPFCHVCHFLENATCRTSVYHKRFPPFIAQVDSELSYNTLERRSFLFLEIQWRFLSIAMPKSFFRHKQTFNTSHQIINVT